MSTNDKGFALVTGASSGIGAVYADRLARRGYDLILVARREDRLKVLAKDIASRGANKVEIVVADLLDPAALQKVEDLLRNDVRITLLVNNAGVAATSPLLSSDVRKMSEIVSLNVEALMRLTYAAVPGFVQRGGGTIINIGSIVAIGPELLNGVYSGSKAFVQAFSQSLKHELADKGVRVQVVLPGVTATELWDNAGYPVENLPKEMVMQTDAMVDAALSGLDQGEFATVPSLKDVSIWESFEQARQALLPNLSLAEPASRYTRSGARLG